MNSVDGISISHGKKEWENGFRADSQILYSDGMTKL
jgi:hypothetical protein